MKKLLFFLIIVFITQYSFTQTWRSFSIQNADTNGAPVVWAFHTYNNKLYLGGDIFKLNNINYHGMVIWDSLHLDSIPNTNNGVRTIEDLRDTIYAGGHMGYSISKWDGTQWYSLGSGLNCDVTSLCIYRGDLYAGGCFTNAGGVTANYVARWNGTSWDSLGSGVNMHVAALYEYKNELYVGGSFTTAGGDSAYGIAQWYIPEDTNSVVSEKLYVENEQLKIFPNPASNNFTVELQNPLNKKSILKIYNTQGQLFRKFIFNESEIQKNIDTSNWQNGIYICTLVVNNKVIAQGQLILDK